MRAAMRPRGDASETTKTPVAVPTSVVANDPGNAIARSEPSAANAAHTANANHGSVAAPEAMSGSGPAPDAIGIAPIAQRKPDQPLSPQQASARSLANLTSIQQAIFQCLQQHGKSPTPYRVNQAGFKTLSWRVELLPYLGYAELYAKFDQNVPWNQEPNLSLLEFIPDVFVSPERFDTNTNYLLPVGHEFMFDKNFPMLAKEDQNTDGKSNTIMLVEVNDALAVPWTSPNDYAPTDTANMKADLGGLRGQGTFAVWGNGYPVMLANELTNRQLLNAFSFLSGDGQLAGTIHRDIILTPASREQPNAPAQAAVVATGAVEAGIGEASTSLSNSPPSNAPLNSSTSSRMPGDTLSRFPVPLASEITASQQRLVQIFADQIQAAQSDPSKLALSREILATAQRMSTDRPGTYALQSAAMKLAIDGGGVAELLDAVDQRVTIFDVDDYELNVNELIEFGKSNANRELSPTSINRFFDRAVRTMFAGLEHDDYTRLAVLAGCTQRCYGQGQSEVISHDLARARALFLDAEKQYSQLASVLVQYRKEPHNGELAATIGRYLCFIKGDWSAGLPLLAKGGNVQLQTVAQLDLSEPQTAEKQIAVADSWWAIAERAKPGVYKQASIERAVQWYERAYVAMPDSLDRLYVKTKIDTAGSIPPTSPLPIVMRLAKHVGINLATGLTAQVATLDD